MSNIARQEYCSYIKSSNYLEPNGRVSRLCGIRVEPDVIDGVSAEVGVVKLEDGDEGVEVAWLPQSAAFRVAHSLGGGKVLHGEGRVAGRELEKGKYMI